MLARRLASTGSWLPQATANSRSKSATDAKMVMEGFQKIANRITAGIVLTALIMGASTLMQVQTSFRL